MCIFCKIINKEIPSSVVYEDEDFLAILDLSQATKGHTIVMPKKHSDNLLEADDDVLSKYLIVVKRVMKKLDESFHPSGFNVLNNCKEMAGQSVLHTHIHVIPRYESNDITIKFTEHKVDLNEVLKEITIRT